MPYIPSEEELEQRGGDYTLMGEDNYRVRVKELKIERKPDNYNDGKLRDQAAVKLQVLSFEDGSELIDNDGNPTSDRLFFDWLDIEKMGLKPRASKARKFTSGAFNQPIAQALEFEDWQELVGKELIAHAIIKNGKNKIDDYRPIPARYRRQAASTPAPVALPGEKLAGAPDGPDLREVAAEIFGADAKGNEDDF